MLWFLQDESGSSSVLLCCIVLCCVVLWTGPSGPGARGLRLFIRLQGELNVTSPLGLPLGVDLRGTRVKGQREELGAKRNQTKILT